MLHVYDVDGVGVWEEGEDTVEEIEDRVVVGTTMTPVEDATLDGDEDVEGWTNVTDVPTATPVPWSVTSANTCPDTQSQSHLHPTSWQLYPGIQHPPFGLSGQLV